jgi:hypothetical protein
VTSGRVVYEDFRSAPENDLIRPGALLWRAPGWVRCAIPSPPGRTVRQSRVGGARTTESSIVIAPHIGVALSFDHVVGVVAMR